MRRDPPGLPDYNIYWRANVSGGQPAVDLLGEEAEVTETVE